MKLILNGREHEHEGAATLHALLGYIRAKAEQVAIVVNDEIVPRQQWDGVQLREGDRVEILTFMGGG